MGAGIIIPIVLVAIIVPIAGVMAKKYLKDGTADHDDAPVVAPSARLTSNALRELPSPTWRVVYEIAEDRLGGIGHVLIGPPGVFALQTSMEPLPDRPGDEHDPRAIAAAAIARGELDDVLRRCGMSSDRLVVVHWGAPVEGAPVAVDTVPGATAVHGRSLTAWAAQVLADAPALTPTQVDLAWQTVTTAIGRPDPLA